MGAVAFNTYEFIKSLTDARMDEEQAAAISAGILRAHEVADLATKSDVREVKTELREVKAELKTTEKLLRSEIRELLAQTDTKIDKVEAKIDQQVTEIKGEIKLLKWMLGMTLTGVGSLIVMAIGLIIKTFFGN